MAKISVEQLQAKVQSTGKKGETHLVEVGGKHTVQFINQGDAVEIILNGSLSETLSGGIHLDFNPMAVCVGKKCMRWPLPKAVPPPVPKPTDEQFLDSVKNKLGMLVVLLFLNSSRTRRF